MKKKMPVLIMSLIIAVSLAACGSRKTSESSSETAEVPETVSEPTKVPEQETEVTVSPEPTPEKTKPETVEEALWMEDDLVGENAMHDRGIFYEHPLAKEISGDEDDVGYHDCEGYIDWFNEDFRDYMQEIYGDEVLSFFEETDIKMQGEDYLERTTSHRNTSYRNIFANTFDGISGDEYGYIVNPDGLFQTYRTLILTGLLNETVQPDSFVPREEEDPVRVLFVDGSRYIGVDRVGILSIEEKEYRQNIIERAEGIWDSLISAHPDDFILTSDLSSADVIIDMYLTYDYAGLYTGGTSVYGSMLCLYAYDTATGQTVFENFKNMPGSSVSARSMGGIVWMNPPKLEEDENTEAFVGTILSWYGQ